MGLLLSGVVGIRPDPSDFITTNRLVPGDGQSATVPRTSKSRGTKNEHPLSIATDGILELSSSQKLRGRVTGRPSVAEGRYDHQDHDE